LANEETTNTNGGRVLISVPIRALIYILAGLAAGGLGTLGITSTKSFQETTRPDPWTATEAREAHRGLEKFIEKELAELESRINERLRRVESDDSRTEAKLEAHLTYSLEKTSDYDSRIASLEARCERAFKGR
jgi:hypothetical protein